MKKEKNDIKLWLFWFSLAVAIIAAYNILGNLAGVAQIIGSILGAIMPFCIGLLIAYILYMPCRSIETLFKKSKKITFFANCSYSIDFSSLSNNNIKINNSTKDIKITVPKIDIFSIDIDENKTIYGDTEVGFFRFGDLKLSSEEINELYSSANDMFRKQMNNQNFFNQTLQNSQKSLEALLFNLTGEHYNITLILSQ